MTKQRDSDTQNGRDRPVEIEVTPEMIQAGLEEMRQYYYGSDMAHMIEEIYRAMAYTARS